MDTALPDEHRMVRETVRDFCEREIEPIAQEIEDEHRFPTEIFEQLADLDMLGVPIAEEDGGLGGDTLMVALVAEELGRVSGSIGLSYVVHTVLVSTPIERFGTRAQKDRWLRPLATGESLGGRALTEPEVGADAADLDVTAERDGDDWVLDGTAQFVGNAVEADAILVTAVTDPDAGSDGSSTFIVDPRADEGLEVTSGREKMGLNASATGEVRLENVRLPEDRLLGEEGEGREQVAETLDDGRISLAALATGLAQGAYERAQAYSREREQFGQPICEFDAVRDTIVEMHRKTERARLLTYRAARTSDEGGSVTREAALAKLEASEAASEVAEDAVQVLGGYGYTTDFAPQRFYRDAKFVETGGGTTESQHRVIGRELGL